MMHGLNGKILQKLGLAAAVWLGVTAAVEAYPWDGAAWADNSAFMSPITQQVKDRCRAIRATTNGQTRTVGRMGQIGDSITYSSAYFLSAACLAQNPNETGHEYLPIRQWLTGDANPGYGSWYYLANGSEKRGKGTAYSCYSGWEITDAVAAGHPANCLNVGLNGVPGNYSWALIMYGTNDIDPPGWTPAAWRTAYSNFVQSFIAQGVIPVLSTIPPERAHSGDGRVESANAVIRALATSMAIPYVDYYALIKHHQPTAWDGTLIGPDGTHPSADGAGFSRMALTTNNGFAARSKLTLDMAEKLKAIVFDNGPAETTNLVAVIDVTPTDGPVPLQVTCSGSRSSDADGTITNYAWTFGDASAPTSGVEVSHTYATAGGYTVTLTVTDNDGNTASTQAQVRAGFVTRYTTNTVVITGTNDVGGLQDTFLYSPQPDNDGYRNTDQFAANSDTNALRIPLLRFDLTNISVKAEVLSAVMTLYCFNISGQDDTVVYPMIKPWSWRYACYNYRDNATWWNAGNQPFDRVPPTADYDAASGVTNREIIAFVPARWDLTRMTSNWVANPSANYGITLIPAAANSETRFRSSNYTNEVDVQPKLVITYRTLTPPPSGMMLMVH